MEDPRRVAAEDRVALGLGQRRVLDETDRREITDAERVVGAEHHFVGPDHVAQIAQRERLEQHRVEIEPAESFLGVGVVRVDRAVALSRPMP